MQRPHLTHRHGAAGVLRPSGRIEIVSEPDQQLLERLDDAVFSALSGCDESLQETRELWPQVVDTVGWELVDESREQYLRYAVETTRQLQDEGIHSPERSLAALEVISLLAR